MHPDADALTAFLERTGDFRVARRIPSAGPVPLAGPSLPNRRIGLVVDCETTGLDPDAGAEIIELGMARFEYDPSDGAMGPLAGTFSELQQPSGGIPVEISRLTGIKDEDVAGRSIGDAEVDAFAAGAHLVVAHNAKFDRNFLERRWPAFARLPWGCSLEQVPWRDEGFEAARLKLLLLEMGWFHRGHRALDDCVATLHLLGLPLPSSGRPAFRRLLEKSRAAGVRIWAKHAPFEAKDLLKRRGYRWSDGSGGAPRAWNIEVAEAEADAELRFLQAEVYRAARSRAVVARVTALDRFSGRAGLPAGSWRPSASCRALPPDGPGPDQGGSPVPRPP